MFFNKKPAPVVVPSHIHDLLHKIIETLQILIIKVNMSNAQIDALTAAVKAESGEVNSAIVLINGITQRITDAVTAALAANPGVDLSPLTDLTNEIQSETTALANAITAAGTGTTVVNPAPVSSPAPAPAPAPVDSGTGSSTTGDGTVPVTPVP